MPTAMQKIDTVNRWHRGKYLIPNAVTLGNMFCGFLTVIYAASYRYEKAVIAIAIAILLDGLDGRIARRLKATSRFGVEFDSFSDFISFGLAPAFLLYCWCFKEMADEFGVIITFIYCLAAASRLARFNISEAATPPNSNFEGLPTPGAAGTVAAFVNWVPTLKVSFVSIFSCSLLLLILSYLMVSKIPYFSVKQLKLAKMNKSVLVLIGTVIALIWYNSSIGFMLLAFLYCASGAFISAFKRKLKGPAHDLIDVA